MRNFLKKISIAGILIIIVTGVISCEQDFTDIGTSIVSNTKFGTDSITLNVTVSQREFDTIRGDNLATGSIGEYWLGIYQDPNGDYEKIEASLVTQLSAITAINLEEGVTDTTKVTLIMDNAFLKFPYLATKNGTIEVTTSINGKDSVFTVPNYSLDNVLGSTTTGVALKVYRNERYLSRLNQANPALRNMYFTDETYQKGELLNDENFTFIPNANDTAYIYNRFLKDGSSYKDTLKLTNGNPFLVVPLDKAKIKAAFFDKLNSSNSSDVTSKTNLDTYFKGLILEVSGNENSLVPFRFSNGQQTFLNPTLEINYSIIVEHDTENRVIDTLQKTISVGLTGIQNRIYKMSPQKNSLANNQVIVQGTAGKSANVTLFSASQLQELRSKNWLINDATITFYVDQSKDMSAIPAGLFLYKQEANYAAQIKDTYTEGLARFSGALVQKSEKNDSYSFKITDYISDVLSPNSGENGTLVLKVFNQTDNPLFSSILDTIVKSYNWNPKAVTLLNEFAIDESRKPKIKISYTEKKN